MNKLFTTLAVTLLTVASMAQSYTFESNYTNWSAQQGTLSLSEEHCKEGSKSLCWQTQTRSTLVVSGFTRFQGASTNAAYLQIYSPSASMDTLVIEFMNGTTAVRTATYVLNHRGWREFYRPYNEYKSTATVPVTAVRMTYSPASSGTHQIFFDDVRFNASLQSDYIPGTGFVVDVDYAGTVNGTNASLRRYAYPIDIPLQTPTADELHGLDSLRLRTKPSPAQNSTGSISARNWVEQNIHITRNADNSPRGMKLNLSASHLTVDSLNTVLDRLVALASGKVYGITGCDVAFDNYIDLLLDQGLAEGAGIAFQSNSYTNPRTIIPKMINVLPACNDQQRAEWIKLLRWVSFYGSIYLPEDTYHANIVSDELYLFLIYQQTIASYHVDDAEAVRELKAMKRYLERCFSYTPGGYDMLKPDGTGFHHNTHYNNYMYSYQTITTGLYNLRNTCYQVDETSFEHFAKAVETIYIMATPGKNDNRFFANTFCGRNPFDSGIKMAYSRTHLRNLIAACEVYPSLCTRLKADLNYFYQAQTYDVPERSFEGFHQFNYSPAGIMRNGTWVASMRAPTTRFWGAEIYSRENRFGRYQAHGALEITYQGINMAYSGYPTNGTGGGWDWNVIPGTTTVHYVSWREMMPSGNLTARHDQYTKGTNFSGALGMGMEGVWASNFDQKDAWGSAARYTPTNLVFKKSVFVFDSLIVALGSDISASGSYDDRMITATNLFQGIETTLSGPFVVDGQTKTAGDSAVLSSDRSHWMLTLQSTGYYIPAGNDDIKYVYAKQKTPVETGADYTSPVNVSTAAKAYINHGVKTSGRQYEFVVVPASTGDRMSQMAERLDRGGVYTVLCKTNSLHAVRMGQTTSYAFFGQTIDINFGIVRDASHQHLLIDRLNADGTHSMAACNPNLEPEVVTNPAVSTGWSAKPTSATLTLEGEWVLREAVDGVSIRQGTGCITYVDLAFSEGHPLYFTLVPQGKAALQTPAASDREVRLTRFADKVRLEWDEQLAADCILYSASGRQVRRQHADSGLHAVEFSTVDLPAGVYICRLGRQNIKIIL